MKIGIKIFICEKNIRDFRKDRKAKEVWKLLKESSKFTRLLCKILLKKIRISF